MKNLALLLSLILLTPGICPVHSVAAQQQTNKITPLAGAPVITAAASAERLRFTAPNFVVQMHLQVYAETGQTVFDVTSKGNALDWTLQDGGGKRLDVGSYVCVITVKSISGKLSQRVGSVAVHEEQIELRRVEAGQLTGAQQQAVGPIEENGALTILKAGEAEPITLVANDGQDGQLIRGRGALSFRLGDFFSGTDREQMRLTEDGRLGIGTDKPEATLDVAGTIRARSGFEFSDGTTLDSTGGRLTVRDANGDTIPAPNAAGTGTVNRLAKWAETGGAGSLTDAASAESGGLTFFGLNAGGQVAPLFPTAPTYHILEVGATGSKSPLTLAGGSGVMEFWKDLGGGMGAPAAAVSFGMAKPGTVSTNDMVFSTYTPSNAWNERMRLTSLGNLGVGASAPAEKVEVAGNVKLTGTGNGVIFPDGTKQTTASAGGSGVTGTGTANTVPLWTGATALGNSVITQSGGNVGIGVAVPAAKLDVAGNINTSTQYNLGGNRILRNDSFANLFVGFGAGQNSLPDDDAFPSGNTFVGDNAGRSNWIGGGNSFFGTNAGFNSMGDSNSFFGYRAGSNNTTGAGNSFFGTSAGLSNVGEKFNTFVGFNSNGATGITNATAIGNRAAATQSNSLVLGSINGVNGATADTKVGIGTTAPVAALNVVSSSTNAGDNTATFKATSIGPNASHIHHGTNGSWFIRSAANTGRVILQDTGGNVGVGTTDPKSKLQVTNGDIFVNTVGTGLIIKSANGSCFRIVVSDGGVLSALVVNPCPN